MDYSRERTEPTLTCEPAHGGEPVEYFVADRYIEMRDGPFTVGANPGTYVVFDGTTRVLDGHMFFLAYNPMEWQTYNENGTDSIVPLTDMPYREIQQFAKSQGIKANGTKDELLARINAAQTTG